MVDYAAYAQNFKPIKYEPPPVANTLAIEEMKKNRADESRVRNTLAGAMTDDGLNYEGAGNALMAQGDTTHGLPLLAEGRARTTAATADADRNRKIQQDAMGALADLIEITNGAAEHGPPDSAKALWDQGVTFLAERYPGIARLSTAFEQRGQLYGMARAISTGKPPADYVFNAEGLLVPKAKATDPMKQTRDVTFAGGDTWTYDEHQDQPGGPWQTDKMAERRPAETTAPQAANNAEIDAARALVRSWVKAGQDPSEWLQGIDTQKFTTLRAAQQHKAGDDTDFDTFNKDVFPDAFGGGPTAPAAPAPPAPPAAGGAQTSALGSPQNPFRPTTQAEIDAIRNDPKVPPGAVITLPDGTPMRKAAPPAAAPAAAPVQVAANARPPVVVAPLPQPPTPRVKPAPPTQAGKVIPIPPMPNGDAVAGFRTKYGDGIADLIAGLVSRGGDPTSQVGWTAKDGSTIPPDVVKAYAQALAATSSK